MTQPSPAARFLAGLFGRQRARVFISYRRRGDGAGYGGRIADRLVEHFGAEQCFRDVEDIESGVDFVVTIDDAVRGCDVLLAVIGPDWLSQTDADGGRRLDDPKDFVRIEVAAALERNIRVIPVLVGGASIPSAEELPGALEGLARRQAHELTDTRWEFDVGELIKSVESIGIRARGSRSRSVARLRWKVPAAIAGVVASGALLAANVPSEPEPIPFAPVPSSYPPPVIGEGSAEETRFAPGSEAAVSPSGQVSVRWQHEGAVHVANVVMHGQHGLAQVAVGPIMAEQDLTLVENESGLFYVGSNVRIPGSAVPHPVYARDIFRLERLPSGRWNVAAVGTGWNHFDPTIVQGY